MLINDYDFEEFSDGAVILDGLDNAIVGIVESFGVGNRILYSKKKIIEELQKQDMDELEALEFYNFNILGLYAGEQNPLFLI